MTQESKLLVGQFNDVFKGTQFTFRHGGQAGFGKAAHQQVHFPDATVAGCAIEDVSGAIQWAQLGMSLLPD